MRITINDRVMLIAERRTGTYAIRLGHWWTMLKGPKSYAWFSERNIHRLPPDQRARFKRIPLARGWRITARYTA